MAVKQFKEQKHHGRPQVKTVLTELSCSLCLNGHKQISLLLDAFCLNGLSFLVFQEWGLTLMSLTHQKVVTATDVPTVLKQCLEGMSFLKQHSILHLDLNPETIRVQAPNYLIREPGQRLHLKIHDFGFARITELHDTNWPDMTYACVWPYKAPEVLLHSPSISFPCDMWCLGLIAYFMLTQGKHMFNPDLQVCDEPERHQLEEILRERPEGMEECFSDHCRWQAFVGSMVSHTRQNATWTDRATTPLDTNCVCLLEAMLKPLPTARIDIGDALAHRFFSDPPCPPHDPNRSPDNTQGDQAQVARLMELYKDRSNNVRFHGARADFHILTGQLQPEVLQLLQGDEFFKRSAADLDTCGFSSFNAPTTDQKISSREFGCKIIISGGIGEPASVQARNLRLDVPFPLQSISLWVAMFKDKNQKAFTSLNGMLRTSLENLTKAQRSKNGQHALDTHTKHWCLTAGNLLLTQASGNLIEAEEQEGGEGMLHMIITLWGAHEVHCWHQGAAGPSASTPDADTIRLPQKPGSVFISCTSAFRYQVHHQPSTELVRVGDHDHMSVAVMIRSCLFPHGSSTGSGAPCPKTVFQLLAADVNKWLSKQTLVFPTLHEVLQAQAPGQTLLEPTGSTQLAAAGRKRGRRKQKAQKN